MGAKYMADSGISGKNILWDFGDGTWMWPQYLEGEGRVSEIQDGPRLHSEF